MTQETPAPAPALPDRAAVLQALDAVRDPKTGRGLAAAGRVQGLALGPGRAGFMIEVPPEDVALYEPVRAEAERVLRELAGVARAQVVLTAEASTGAPAPSPSPRRAMVSPEAERRNRPSPMNPVRPAHVRRVLAVASGKGGVGKSTLAVNLACALAARGLRIGLADADIYGPSLPTMLGLSERPEVDAERKLIPLQAWGLKAVSIGLIVDPGSAMVWRGPMASQALTQIVHETAWGTQAEPLDLLVVDLPPGTGDVQLTLVQKTALDGAVIVSTPQAVALADVRRGAAMFAKVGVPVLGVIENMAYFPDPATGERHFLFGQGGARQVAAELGAPFLGETPLDPRLREGADIGRPLVATDPLAPASQAITEAAARLAERLGL